LLLLFPNRRVRAVGPMVLSFMIVATAGSLLTWLGMFYRKAPDILVWLGSALHVSRWGMWASCSAACCWPWEHSVFWAG
jgi:hypothetical protein